MVRERETGFSTESHTQDPGVEIVKAGSLGREESFRRTPLMRQIEEQHEGRSIREILDDLYWVQEKGSGQIGKELGRPERTIHGWRIKVGTGTRSPLDVFRARSAWSAVKRQSGAIPSPTRIKLNEVKKRFELESDEVLKTFLEEKYKQYKSQGAMVKAFRDSGIKVGERIVKNWMLYFGIENTLLEEHDKSTVKKAVESGDFGRLTQKQQEILIKRGYLQEGRLVPFRKLEEVLVGRLTFQAASDTEAGAFRRLENGGVRSTMKPEERRFIQEHPDFPVRQLAVMFGRKQETIRRYKGFVLGDAR